ncbi:MAG: anthranilate phosphoribosyltransferase [Gemmatimonadales bacterium]|nr:MAG: anthranilate phosphoribosyltransferase [Gemmatimonadales bacterium]
MDLTSLIARVTDGHPLTVGEAESAFGTIMAGDATPVQIAAFLAGLRARGHHSDEIAGGVRALRAAMVEVAADPEGRPLIDTCGTGGGSVTTFNISTAAALVVAAGGVRVAKHGNRSFTSKSGSADVLEALGVRIEMTPDAMARVLAEVGIVFMFAPLLHPAMRHVGPVRRELRIPTIMNLLGPLTNPAGVRRQVVGVSSPELLPLISRALQTLGHERALVVYGEGGLDEVSPLGPTRVVELKGGELVDYRIDPESVGLDSGTPDEIAGGEPGDNARVIRGVLEGGVRGGARTVVLLNAAAGLLVADEVGDFAEGVERAAHAVDSGAALDRLEALIEASDRVGATP